MTKDEAQRRDWTFYEAVNFKGGKRECMIKKKSERRFEIGMGK